MPAARQTRRARAARRRTKRVAASGSDLTNDQWFRILEAWGSCAYCGADGVALQKDCVLPISRGGRYTLDNVVPACASCNASKCNTELTSWMRRRRLDEPQFLRRWIEITRALAAPDDVTAEPAPAS
jgi:5-methylcytosine-specific restriction endonuclease McrA